MASMALSAVLLLTAVSAKAQLQVTEASTDAQVVDLVENLFVGGCVSISNVTYTGFANPISGLGATGSFQNGQTTNLGINEGIVLTTGIATNAVGPNNNGSISYGNANPGDVDLTAIVGLPTYDAAVIEFDFVPLTETVSFRYVFGSDEYSEYVQQGFNDPFGFFISGPGFAGPYSGGAVNIALVPSSSVPVSIDNVNNGFSPFGPGGGPCTNCAYYVENNGGGTIQYDGFTTVLTAVAQVQICETYHIKIVIADAGDNSVDSGVFLQAGSFSAGETVAVDVTTIDMGTEGCTTDLFAFTRTDASTIGTDAVVQIAVSGTAIPGVDYVALPSSVTIPAGQMSAILSVETLMDFNTEGNESIIVTLTNTACGCTPIVPPSATAFIQDQDTPLDLNTAGGMTICVGQTVTLTATPSGSPGPYVVNWDNGAGTGTSVDVAPLVTTTYTATATDGCGSQQATSAQTVTVVLADFMVNYEQQCFETQNFEFTNLGYSGPEVTHDWDFGDGNTATVEHPVHVYAAVGSYVATHTVTWIISGCESVIVTNVDVWENPDPTASVVQDVSCTGQGEVTVQVAGGASPYEYLWSNGATTATVSGLGAGNISVVVTDDNGCEGQSQTTVSSVLGAPPSAVCQNITVQLDASGNATITAAQVDNGSSDVCGITSMVVSPSSFDCSDIGVNSVTLTVENTQGLTATCNATVTVQDAIPPTAVCQNMTIQLDGSGNASITAAQIDNGSSDNCGISSIAVSPSTFTCGAVGANTVTLTVTDVNGLVSTCDATVTVQETTPPTAVCQNITVQLDANGNASITAAQIDNGSSDNCGIASMVVSPSAFTCANIGANAVTLTVTDVSGNVATCNATVTVQDLVPPTAVCQNITVQLDATGNATITAAQINNGSSDNCGVQSITVSPNTFTCVNIGANAVTLTVTDVSGLTATCNATVTVQDVTPPTAVCQNITVQLDASGNAGITAAQINNGSSDNCGIASLAVSPNTFTCADLGANTVTLTVTDVNGLTSTCNATVTVQETTPPVAICQNINVQLDATGNVSITAAQVDNGSNDNCGIASMTVSPSSFSCVDIGANTVTLTVTDLHGNTSTCTAVVTVQDLLPPVAGCQDITVTLNVAGIATITPFQINNGSGDNCGVQSLTVTPDTFTCADYGTNQVTLTVTDVNGLSSTCTATVTVAGASSVVAQCQNISVQLDATGNATILPADVNNGSSAECGAVNLSIDRSNFSCADLGANTVVLTATDAFGNEATCNAIVTVQDNVPPIANCQNITVQLDASGNATITAAQINNGSSDNCGIQSVTVSPSAFTCADIGANTVTLTVTDMSGNVSTCNATVTVQELVLPTATCQNITVQLDASGNASITAAQVNNGSSDNCGIQSVTVSPSAFTCADLGANTVTLTVTDVSGNTSTCNAIVTVQDVTPPTAVCQNITVQLNASGNAIITAAQINNGSTDNCGIQSVAVSPSAFTCLDLGANTVTLTVTDVNGNTATCTATVTVQDNISPTVVCQNVTVQVGGAGNVTVTPAQIDNGSADNCAIASMSLSPNSFSCADLGANTVTLTVTDAGGNTASCNATVTVQSVSSLIAICQNITLPLDASGNASITADDVDNGSGANCGAAILSIDQSQFTCANLGANTVTLTATDGLGNSETCASTVTVVDLIPPTAVCQNITVNLDASGNANITAAQIDNGSSDNCGIQNIVVSPSSFTCVNVGANTVTLTVTDLGGNTSTCTATVTVLDNSAPNALCQNLALQLDASGESIITAAQIDNGSSDNCGIQSLVLNQSTFTCANVGANPVTLTVTDVNGNVGTCNATVTVADVIPPVAICQDITIQVGGAGSVIVTPAQVDNGSSDNCSITSMVLSPNSFSCNEIGPNAVTLTVTDASGNQSSCQATITVEGSTGPLAVCQDVTIQLDNNGNATITAAQVDNGSGANCGDVSIFIDQNSFTCADLGANTVTLTAADGIGFPSTCTATVTVQDLIPPVAVCQDITVQVGGVGLVTIQASDVDNGSSDNCSIASISVSPSSFNCSNVGPNQVTLTVTDGSGNVATCTATVTVEVPTGLSALCQDLTVQLDAFGNATISANDVDNGSNSLCGAFDIAIDQSTFNCSDLGTNTVTLTISNLSGNTASCASTVTVQDLIPPVAVCQNVTIQVNGAGTTTLAPQQVDNGSSDNCAIVSMSVSPDSFTCAEAGPNTVTLTVTDASGNTGTCTAIVTVEVISGLVAQCQDVTVLLDANGAAIINASDVDGGSGADCGAVAIAIDRENFSCEELGVNAVTLTVADAFGASATCTANVTVEDAVAPAFTFCPADQSIQLEPGVCDIVVIWNAPVAEDNCPLTITSTHQSGDVFTVGTTTVTFTATDGAGNTATCSFEVEVLSGGPLAVDLVIAERACGYNISCHGLADASAEVFISGGCAPYSVLWSTGAVTTDVSGLAADTYNVTVTDASGESVVLLVQPSQPTPVALSAPSLSSYIGGVNISCKGGNDGSISIGASGGADCVDHIAGWVGPNGFTSAVLDINGLFAGEYQLTVEDANGCTVETAVTLTEPEALVLSFNNVTQVSCPGLENGSASVSVDGGTEPYTLQFENGDPVDALIGLVADNYTIVLVDANGCEVAQTLVITEPEQISVLIDQVADASCFGLSDGEAELDIFGGNGPYTVSWQGGQSGAEVTGLAVGMNIFTITDANGCTATDSLEIGSPPALVIDSVDVTGVSCLGGSDGGAIAFVSGGQAPYAYTWTPSGLGGNPVSGLSLGNHQVTVTDDNGCTATQAIIVTQPPGLSIVVSADTTVCPGEPVVVSAEASGGAGGFTYSWNNGLGAGAQHLVSPTVPISYAVTATDANGCTISGQSVTVTLHSVPQSVFTAVVEDPCVIPAQFITANNSSGATSYNWYQGTVIIPGNSPVITYNAPGTYTLALVAISAQGCTDSVSTVVTVQAPPVANFVVSNSAGCLPLGTVFTSIGTGAQSYSWDFGDGQTGTGGSVGHSYFAVGSYDVTLTVTSSLGCTDSFSIDDAVTVHPDPIADFNVIDLEVELGGSFQFINTSQGAETYGWQFGDGGFSQEENPTHDYENPGDVNVTLTAISAFGCVDTARYTVDVIIRRALYVPNAIAIGNEDGAGVFRPVGVGIAQYRALIFDKWGNQLWESTELEAGSPVGFWDGMYRGKLVPQGSYVWNVEARFLDGTLWEGMVGSDGEARPSGTVTVLY
jgi:PKD repeat protein